MCFRWFHQKMTAPECTEYFKLVYALNAKGTGGYLYQEIDAAANMDYVLNLTWSNLSPTNGKVRVYAGKVFR